jgi:hypothetical protein
VTTIQTAAHNALVLVKDRLPPKTQELIEPILAKDQLMWTRRDKLDVSIALAWAIQNL